MEHTMKFDSVKQFLLDKSFTEAAAAEIALRLQVARSTVNRLLQGDVEELTAAVRQQPTTKE
jgi:hypothetical protein